MDHIISHKSLTIRQTWWLFIKSQSFWIRSALRLRTWPSSLHHLRFSNCFSPLSSGCWSAPICRWHTTLHLCLSIFSVRWSPHTWIFSGCPISRVSLNCLALNPDKSDAILLGTRQRNSSLSSISHINVAGSLVPISESVKLLGVTLDKSLTFQKHVNQVSQSCYYHMKALRHIRHCLDDKTASLITHALISSRLDYANSLLFGSPNYVINKLQCIQNSLARIVLQSDCRAHSEPLLRQLHWLPVQSRIRFKLATITYKALFTNSPTLPCFSYPLSPTCPFSSLLWPALSSPDSI